MNWRHTTTKGNNVCESMSLEGNTINVREREIQTNNVVVVFLFDFAMNEYLERKESFRRKGLNKDNKQPRKYELIDWCLLGLIKLIIVLSSRIFANFY